MKRSTDWSIGREEAEYAYRNGPVVSSSRHTALDTRSRLVIIVDWTNGRTAADADAGTRESDSDSGVRDAVGRRACLAWLGHRPSSERGPSFTSKEKQSNNLTDGWSCFGVWALAFALGRGGSSPLLLFVVVWKIVPCARPPHTPPPGPTSQGIGADCVAGVQVQRLGCDSGRPAPQV